MEHKIVYLMTQWFYADYDNKPNRRHSELLEMRYTDLVLDTPV
jgi:hypothetical protein